MSIYSTFFVCLSIGQATKGRNVKNENAISSDIKIADYFFSVHIPLIYIAIVRLSVLQATIGRNVKIRKHDFFGPLLRQTIDFFIFVHSSINKQECKNIETFLLI